MEATLKDFDKESFLSNLANIRQSIVEEIFSPIKQIYIDWTYLQDVYLGSMISLCKNQEEYNYIRSNIEGYNNRIIREHTLLFRKLFKSDLELEEYMNDTEKSSLLLVMSPMTNMFNNIKVLLKSIIERNKKLGYETPLKVILNMYPLAINDISIKIIKEIMNHCYLPYLQLGIVTEKISDIDIDTLINSEILLIDRFDYFLSDNTKTQEAFYTAPISKFFDCAVITPKFIDNKEIINKLETLSKEEIESTFDITSSVCGLSSSFQYISPIILLEE